MIKFSAGEVFEMARQMERNGAAFYRKAAENVSEKDLRELLLCLAAMEDDHERTFAGMADKLAASDRWRNVFDPDGQGARYLRVMVAGKVFDSKDAGPAARLTGTETSQEILVTAIGLENDSILFYLGMKEAVSGDRGHVQIDGIIRQEMNHVADLTQQLTALP